MIWRSGLFYSVSIIDIQMLSGSIGIGSFIIAQLRTDPFILAQYINPVD
jgi:hypothetical protein